MKFLRWLLAKPKESLSGFFNISDSDFVYEDNHGWVLVGERGPEIVQFTGNETFLTAQQLTKFGLGGQDEPERPDLKKWRWRDALRRSNAAQPKPSGKKYRRRDKHRKRDTE